MLLSKKLKCCFSEAKKLKRGRNFYGVADGKNFIWVHPEQTFGQYALLNGVDLSYTRKSHGQNARIPDSDQHGDH